MSLAGPIKPIKNPKLKKISLAEGNFAWLDAEENLEAGVGAMCRIFKHTIIYK